MFHPTHTKASPWCRFTAGFDRRQQALTAVQTRHVPASRIVVGAAAVETTMPMAAVTVGTRCGFKGHEPGDPARETCEDCASTKDIISHYAAADEPELATMVQPRHGRPYAVHADQVLAELWADVERTPGAPVEPAVAPFLELLPIATVRPPLPPKPVAEPEPDPIDLAVAELLATWDANFALHMREAAQARQLVGASA